MSFLKPRYFFSGVAAGLIACSIAGQFISQHFRYNHFTRFFSSISNTLDFLPVAHELLATAQHKASTNKILVLIGGNSILRGDGQNEDELWSLRLQKKLGNQYQVLNYGFNGAQFTAFGGVAYRILSEYYKKIIFISTCSFSEATDIDGGKNYGYLFWDAYYKNLFHPNAVEAKQIKRFRSLQLKTNNGIELHLMSYLDSKLYFRNLWNWVGYRYFFTIWNKNAYPLPLQARRHFRDIKVDIESLAATTRKSTERFKGELDGLHALSFATQVNFKSHHLSNIKQTELHEMYDQIFSERYRPNTLCIFPTYNPRHISKLSLEEQKAYKILMEDAAVLTNLLGYNTMTTKNLTPNDYIDHRHPVKSGGNKIADQTAKEIYMIAKKLGYLS